MKRRDICGKERRVSMTTVIRPELSEKNKYWVEKHRYYELKHFCLQYPMWKKAYLTLDGLSKRPSDFTIYIRTNSKSNPTERCAIEKSFYSNRIALIERIAVQADPDLASYIIKGVTEELSYTNLKSRLDIPCSRDTYYDRYRRFFWLLDKERE